MIVECKTCKKKYRVDESRIKGRRARIICKACGDITVIHSPASEPEPVPPGEQDALNDFSMQTDAALAPPAPITADELAAIEERPEPERPERIAGGKAPVEGISIKSKITLVIVLLVLASLTVVGLLASHRSRQALSGQAERHLYQYALLKAGEYGNTFARIQDEVQGVADYAERAYRTGGFTTDTGMRVLLPWTGTGYGNPAVRDKLQNEIFTIQRIGVVLKSMVAKNPYLSLGYIGTETRMTAFDKEEVVGVIEGLEGFDVTARPWYVKAKEAGKTIWTEPYTDANTGKLVWTCATPVYRRDNTLAGIVGFDVTLDTIEKDILMLDIGYQSHAFLMNDKGKTLFRPGMKQQDVRWDSTYETEDLLKTDNPSFNRITLKMTQGRKGVETYSSEEGERYIAYAPIQAVDASMGIVASRDEVVRPAIEIQTAILFIWVVVLVISIIIGLFLGSSITRPINELTVMADLISQGKMDLEVMDESRKDEIGVLTQAFNRLVISLKMAMSR